MHIGIIVNGSITQACISHEADTSRAVCKNVKPGYKAANAAQNALLSQYCNWHFGQDIFSTLFPYENICIITKKKRWKWLGHFNSMNNTIDDVNLQLSKDEEKGADQ